MIKWLVVDAPLSYNAIISWGMHTTVHMRTNIKFLTVVFERETGDATIYIDQKRSVLAIAQRGMKEEVSMEDIEIVETEYVKLEAGHVTRIVTNLPEQTSIKLVNLLQIAQHSVNINPKACPIK